MKTIIRFTTLLLTFSLFTFSSCKKDLFDELPGEYVTTYTGSLGYNLTEPAPISNLTSGVATISGSNRVYTINFSDKVPSISGLRFKKTNGVYASVATDGSVAGIKFEGNTMSVAYSKDNNTWGFTGTK